MSEENKGPIFFFFVSTKGGVGKTFLAQEFGAYARSKNHDVLYIEADFTGAPAFELGSIGEEDTLVDSVLQLRFGEHGLHPQPSSVPMRRVLALQDTNGEETINVVRLARNRDAKSLARALLFHSREHQLGHVLSRILAYGKAWAERLAPGPKQNNAAQICSPVVIVDCTPGYSGLTVSALEWRKDLLENPDLARSLGLDADCTSFCWVTSAHKADAVMTVQTLASQLGPALGGTALNASWLSIVVNRLQLPADWDSTNSFPVNFLVDNWRKAVSKVLEKNHPKYSIEIPENGGSALLQLTLSCGDPRKSVVVLAAPFPYIKEIELAHLLTDIWGTEVPTGADSYQTDPARIAMLAAASRHRDGLFDAWLGQTESSA